MKEEIIQWLLEGDVSIQYQVNKDLLEKDDIKLQSRIEKEGWGSLLLRERKNNGHWGLSFYQPKWTSSHYTLLDLRNLWISPNQKEIQESIRMISQNEKGIDGGINPSGTINKSDVCINGMFLYYACYFKIEEDSLKSIIDFVLSQQMTDGGFNCMLNRSGAKHSSLHTTISAIEGLTEYLKNNYNYRSSEVLNIKEDAKEFILQHQLFKSDKTDEIINPNFLKFPYPSRWRYDILRALDYFRFDNSLFDQRLMPALEYLKSKQHKDDYWKQSAKHPGATYFEMEKAGKASRWNTLRALRVLKHFDMVN